MTKRERLILIISKYFFENENGASVDGLADYLLANGVIVPPCKVGDTVYQTDNAGDIYESEITQVVYGTKGIAFDERAIGESVFLTREEAEKGLWIARYKV